MKTIVLGLLAETPIHPGSGRSLGVVDLPVAREAATDYPVLPGSGLKGALRDLAEQKDAGAVDTVFGTQGQAGEVLISDGRLLLLPVRSLSGAYRWATCPHLLERFLRDVSRAGLDIGIEIPAVQRGATLTKGEQWLYLEERQFTVVGEPPEAVVTALKQVLPNRAAEARLADQLAILSDDDFAWFARYGLQVQARNVLEDGTKKSKNLWYEEALPPDTVMYTLIAGRTSNSLSILTGLFDEGGPYLQAGGNETVGQGWFAVRVLEPSGKELA